MSSGCLSGTIRNRCPECLKTLRDDHKPFRSYWGGKCVNYLYANFTEYRDQVKEYIDEAEHQDGYEYWCQFNTQTEVGEDFKLFAQEIDKLMKGVETGKIKF